MYQVNQIVHMNLNSRDKVKELAFARLFTNSLLERRQAITEMRKLAIKETNKKHKAEIMKTITRLLNIDGVYRGS